MGLDMYLGATKALSFDEDGYTEAKDILKDVVKDWNPYSVVRVSTTAIQWRKANAIHNWFVANVQNGNDDCAEYSVPFTDLVYLMEVCGKVIANPDLAEELLPTADGFFFGGTAYDSYYHEEVVRTHEALTALIEHPDREIYFTYQSSW